MFRSRRRFVTAMLLTVPLLTLAHCSGPTPARPMVDGTRVPTVEGWETEAIATLGATPEPVAVTIGLPFKPDVQFTPFYVADERGYFRDRGFDVSFDYGDESTFVRLVAARKMVAMVASGEQVILARAGEVPVTYVATWYHRFPGVVVSTDAAIAAPEDLVGRAVGLPAPSGASFTGWRALLAANDIDPADVPTEVIGYTQVEAVTQGRVDAAVGYAANEPIQLETMGLTPTVIEIADSFNLVSNGLVVAETMIIESPTVVQALVEGALLGIRDTLADPDAAFEVALRAVPEAASDPAVRAQQRRVLDASLRFWETQTLGAISAADWQASQDFLLEAGYIESATPIEQLIDQQFVDAAGVER